MLYFASPFFLCPPVSTGFKRKPIETARFSCLINFERFHLHGPIPLEHLLMTVNGTKDPAWRVLGLRQLQNTLQATVGVRIVTRGSSLRAPSFLPNAPSIL